MQIKKLASSSYTAIFPTTVGSQNQGLIIGEVSASSKLSLAWKDVALLNTSSKTIYISSAGSDANDGSTTGQAVATMHKASELSPNISTAPVIWKFINSGTYTWSECKTQFVGNNGRWTLFGAPETRIISLTTTASAGSSARSIFSAGLTTNQYQGNVLEIISGAASGSLRTIQQNTTTEILPVLQFESQTFSSGDTNLLTINSGDSYRIYRPGVIITGLSGTSDKKILMRDISFDTLTEVPIFKRCEVLGQSVEFRGTAGIAPRFEDSRANFGLWGVGIDVSFSKVTSSYSEFFNDFELSTTGTGSFVQNCGLGISYPDITSGPASTIASANSQLQLIGTLPGLNLNNCNAQAGGYFWGLVNHTFGMLYLIGRTRNSAITTGSILREGILMSSYARCTLMSHIHLSIQTVGRIGLIMSDNCSAAVSAGLTIDASTSTAAAIRLTNRSLLSLSVGSLFITSSMVDVADTWSVIDIGEQSSFIQGTSMYAHNTSTGELISCRGYWNCNNTTVLSGSSGLHLARGGILATTGSLTLTGPLIIDGGEAHIGANLTVSNNNDAISIKNCGTFSQFAGVLSASSTSNGDAMKAEGVSRVRLRGTTNVILIGSGTNKAGLRAKSGASVWFSDAPTSVQGPESKDLIIGSGNITESNAILSTDESFITDGGGTIIGRST